MSKQVLPTQHIGCLVLTTALGRHAKPIQRETERLIRNNGVEWTCARIKAIWNAANHLKNGDKQNAIEVFRSEGIAYHSDGTPKGPWRYVVRQFVKAERPVAIKRFAACMRYYCGMVLGTPSRKQIQKGLRSITGAWKGDEEDLDSLLSFLYQNEPRSVAVSSSDKVEDKLEALGHNLTFYVSTQTKGYNPVAREAHRYSEKNLGISDFDYWFPLENQRQADGLKLNSAYFSRTPLPKAIHLHEKKAVDGWGRKVQEPGTPGCSMALSFMTETWLPKSLDMDVPCFEMREGIRSQSLDWDGPFSGKIMILQEQGCKPRIAAQPSAWLQLAFKPLHKAMSDLADKHPSSCVRNQVYGAKLVAGLMQEGKEVFCTDLSSATDRFPRRFIEGMLLAMGFPQFADALEEVSSRPFVASWLHSKEGSKSPRSINYSVGQPMGLYGSFPMFQNAHLIVCETAERWARSYAIQKGQKPLSEFGNRKTFVVLGDDVCFSDKRVELVYRSIMTKSLGVDISEAKSYRGRVAEFAGFMFYRTKSGKSVAFRPYKVPVKDTVTNPIQFLDAMGVKPFRQMKPRRRQYWLNQYARFQRTVKERDWDLSPLVRDDSRVGIFSKPNNHMMVNLCQNLAIAGENEIVLPDLSGDTHINRIPLYGERNISTLSVWDRETYQDDRDETFSTEMHLRTDPLMERERYQEMEKNGYTPSNTGLPPNHISPDEWEAEKRRDRQKRKRSKNDLEER